MARNTRLVALAGTLTAGLLFAPSSAAAQEQPAGFTKTAIVLPAISVRQDVTADLALTIFTDRSAVCTGRTLLAVHGMLHTAAAWEPFASALFDRLPPGERPCRVLALDLPGHGHSSVPAGARFGELTIDDYVTAVLASLSRLHDVGLYPEVLVGHSLGGAILTLVQQRLATDGSNLRWTHGVRDVVVIAAAVMNPIQDDQWDSGAAFAGFYAYALESPELGRYISYPVSLWRNPLFKNLASPPQFASGAPSTQEIIDRGYFGPQGSAFALESRGMLESMVPRPFVNAGSFDSASGTRLTMVVYEQDRLVSIGRSVQFYTHLTGDPYAPRILVVPGPDAVHDMHVSAPACLIAAIGALVRAF